MKRMRYVLFGLMLVLLMSCGMSAGVDYFTDEEINVKSITYAPIQLETAMIDIGDWNMDVVGSVAIPHGMDFDKIKYAQVMIKNDYGPIMPFENTFAPNFKLGGFLTIDETNIYLYRAEKQVFDSNMYDEVPFNRGWVIIWYVN